MRLVHATIAFNWFVSSYEFFKPYASLFSQLGAEKIAYVVT